jgi:hypothetical protein
MIEQNTVLAAQLRTNLWTETGVFNPAAREADDGQRVLCAIGAEEQCRNSGAACFQRGS